MKSTPPLQRRYLGCGYEPPIDGPRTLWRPPGGSVGYRGPEPTTCAGFTTSLPEVTEVAVMRRHWSTGNLAVALLGDQPTEDLTNAIVVLDGEFNAVERWCMTPAKDGGGGS